MFIHLTLAYNSQSIYLAIDKILYMEPDLENGDTCIRLINGESKEVIESYQEISSAIEVVRAAISYNNYTEMWDRKPQQ